MGGSEPTTSTTKAEPWSVQQPYLEDAYKRAQRLYGYNKPLYESKKKAGTGQWVPLPQQDEKQYNPRNTGDFADSVTRRKGIGGIGDEAMINMMYPNAQRGLIPGTNTQGIYIPEEFEQVKTGEEWVEGEGTLQYFPDATVAQFTPEQLQAQGLISSRALMGSPLAKAGKEYATDVVQGRYVNPESNPYLKYYVEEAQQNILPQIDTTAVSSGRYGSGAWRDLKSNAYGDIANQIYGGAYNTERAYQQALGMAAPELAATDYYDYQKLYDVGTEKQSMEQALIDAAREKWEFEQMAPWEQLATYVNIIQGDMGGQTASLTGGGK